MFIPPTPNLFAMSMSEHLGSFFLRDTGNAAFHEAQQVLKKEIAKHPKPKTKRKRFKPPVDEAHGISGGEHDCVKQAIAEHLGMEEPE